MEWRGILVLLFSLLVICIEARILENCKLVKKSSTLEEEKGSEILIGIPNKVRNGGRNGGSGFNNDIGREGGVGNRIGGGDENRGVISGEGRKDDGSLKKATQPFDGSWVIPFSNGGPDQGYGIGIPLIRGDPGIIPLVGKHRQGYGSDTNIPLLGGSSGIRGIPLIRGAPGDFPIIPLISEEPGKGYGRIPGIPGIPLIGQIPTGLPTGTGYGDIPSIVPKQEYGGVPSGPGYGVNPGVPEKGGGVVGGVGGGIGKGGGIGGVGGGVVGGVGKGGGIGKGEGIGGGVGGGKRKSENAGGGVGGGIGKGGGISGGIGGGVGRGIENGGGIGGGGIGGGIGKGGGFGGGAGGGVGGGIDKGIGFGVGEGAGGGIGGGIGKGRGVGGGAEGGLGGGIGKGTGAGISGGFGGGGGRSFGGGVGGGAGGGIGGGLGGGIGKGIGTGIGGGFGGGGGGGFGTGSGKGISGGIGGEVGGGFGGGAGEGFGGGVNDGIGEGLGGGAGGGFRGAIGYDGSIAGGAGGGGGFGVGGSGFGLGAGLGGGIGVACGGGVGNVLGGGGGGVEANISLTSITNEEKKNDPHFPDIPEEELRELQLEIEKETMAFSEGNVWRDTFNVVEGLGDFLVGGSRAQGTRPQDLEGSLEGYLRKGLFVQVATLCKEGYACKKAMHAWLIRGSFMQGGQCSSRAAELLQPIQEQMRDQVPPHERPGPKIKKKPRVERPSPRKGKKVGVRGGSKENVKQRNEEDAAESPKGAEEPNLYATKSPEGTEEPGPSFSPLEAEQLILYQAPLRLDKEVKHFFATTKKLTSGL
ncbi:glycine-rich cell wall structural protein 1.8-like [Lycium barbarum]|uniref:glycine-rich cell wall structural protein 1.8-like n=1 Tax=Lycium barbarum TaxID=112863 RepID=UPI00293F5CE0|nr:glycine-rich cell wall structural protein 1.8-like [Lycium barbarum]